MEEHKQKARGVPSHRRRFSGDSAARGNSTNVVLRCRTQSPVSLNHRQIAAQTLPFSNRYGPITVSRPRERMRLKQLSASGSLTLTPARHEAEAYARTATAETATQVSRRKRPYTKSKHGCRTCKSVYPPFVEPLPRLALLCLSFGRPLSSRCTPFAHPAPCPVGRVVNQGSC